MFRAIDIALSQLGVHEATGKNDGIPAQRYMHGDEFAWCAGFVLYCNANSDDETLATTTKEHYEMRSVAKFMEIAKRKGIFLGVRHEDGSLRVPLRNDIVFFGNTDSDVGVKGNHIGIIEVVDTVSGGAVKIQTIEGNYGNKVSRVLHTLGEKKIVGFARSSLIASGIS